MKLTFNTKSKKEVSTYPSLSACSATLYNIGNKIETIPDFHEESEHMAMKVDSVWVLHSLWPPCPDVPESC